MAETHPPQESLHHQGLVLRAQSLVKLATGAVLPAGKAHGFLPLTFTATNLHQLPRAHPGQAIARARLRLACQRSNTHPAEREIVLLIPAPTKLEMFWRAVQQRWDCVSSQHFHPFYNTLHLPLGCPLTQKHSV